jgi:hypothetical protein
MKSKPTQNKESKVNELTQKLKDGVQQFYSSERWIEFLKVQSKFHNYSFNNVLLILLQRPGSSQIAGYGTWKAMGRQVNTVK